MPSQHLRTRHLQFQQTQQIQQTQLLQGGWSRPAAPSVGYPDAARPDGRRPAHGHRGGAPVAQPQPQPRSPFVNSANMHAGTANRFNMVAHQMNWFLRQNGNNPGPARQVTVPPPMPVQPTLGALPRPVPARPASGGVPPPATRLGTVVLPRMQRPAVAEPGMAPPRRHAEEPRSHHARRYEPTLAVANHVQGRMAGLDINARSVHIRGLPASSRHA